VTVSNSKVHALLFGLNEDLAGELLRPLRNFCSEVQAVAPGRPAENLKTVADSSADVIFCDADMELVSALKSIRPDSSIVVVSRHPEVSGWLDSIEAGASDYCAAPFEPSQLKWILESSLRNSPVR